MVSPITFLREAYEELKKVSWPSYSEVGRLTMVVIVISVIVGIYIGGLDLLFTKIMETLIK